MPPFITFVLYVVLPNKSSAPALGSFPLFLNCRVELIIFKPFYPLSLNVVKPSWSHCISRVIKIFICKTNVSFQTQNVEFKDVRTHRKHACSVHENKEQRCRRNCLVPVRLQRLQLHHLHESNKFIYCCDTTEPGEEASSWKNEKRHKLEPGRHFATQLEPTQLSDEHDLNSHRWECTTRREKNHLSHSL